MLPLVASGVTRTARPLTGFSRLGIIVLSSVATLAAQAGPYERQRIDGAAATRGRAVYAQHCINCPGAPRRGRTRALT